MVRRGLILRLRYMCKTKQCPQLQKQLLRQIEQLYDIIDKVVLIHFSHVYETVHDYSSPCLRWTQRIGCVPENMELVHGESQYQVARDMCIPKSI